MNTPDSSSASIATLDLERGPFQPSETFARAAYGALSNYLRALKSGGVSSQLSVEVIEAVPVPAAPRLDAMGYWRLGVWLLETRGGDLALTYRPTQAEPRIEYVATLKEETEAVSVISLTMRQLHPRR